MAVAIADADAPRNVGWPSCDGGRAPDRFEVKTSLHGRVLRRCRHRRDADARLRAPGGRRWNARSRSWSASAAARSELRPQIALLEARARELQQKIFAELTALAEGPALAPPGAALHARLHRAPVRRASSSCTATAASPTTRRSSAASARSTGCRCWCSATRRGAAPRRTCSATSACRKPEGYRKALRLMELAARMRPPDPLPHRHAGRLPGHRRRGARPGRGDRQEPGGDGRPAGADRLRRDRRGRLGRRAGARRRPTGS